MVDFLSSAGNHAGGVRHMVGRTRGMLKSRLLSVIEGSNDIITGLSSKLESALSLSTDSLSDTSTDIKEPHTIASNNSETFNKKLRLPDFGTGLSFEDYTAISRHKHDKDKESERLQLQTADDNHESMVSSDSIVTAPEPPDLKATGPDPYDKLKYKTDAPSSGSASDADGYGPSTSIDSEEHNGKKFWVRSGSEGSVQSWASSLSLDSQSDEATAEAVEFMRSFVAELFKSSANIQLDQKSKFGKLVQHEAGRLWFSRFVNAQRGQNKRVDESTFYSLVQYFAIVLFECADADDFSPAKSLMNMCFTFYHEVEVPGCEPYKEYLSTYLREQTIWHSLRFWNAAFFDALQCERVHRPVVTREDVRQNRLEALTDEKQYQENITFGQLGTFTCNMHAFGLSKELCAEFLRKQCTIANLREDQEKMLRDNVETMYRETDPWRY